MRNQKEVFSKNICLNYHAFSGSNTNDNLASKYTVDFELFKQHLVFLQEIQNLGLQELLFKNKFRFSYTLTFDDGYKSHLYIADELAKCGIKGTFYIITNEASTNSRYLSKNDLKIIDSLGMEIGSHTCSHRHVNRLSINEMVHELNYSKCYLEDILSKPIRSISYPGGHFGMRELIQAKKEGYETQRTCITGLNNLPIDDQIIKCYNIKNFVTVDYLNNLMKLKSPLRLLIKMREIGLIIPKFIDSKLKFM
jgi:peptidoglycan/xylan/chitin deacetylase (PgdA/CDA1 family)